MILHLGRPRGLRFCCATKALRGRLPFSGPPFCLCKCRRRWRRAPAKSLHLYYYPSRFSRAATIFLGAAEGPARPVANARGSVLGLPWGGPSFFVVRPAFSVCGEGALGKNVHVVRVFRGSENINSKPRPNPWRWSWVVSCWDGMGWARACDFWGFCMAEKLGIVAYSEACGGDHRF